MFRAVLVVLLINSLVGVASSAKIYRLCELRNELMKKHEASKEDALKLVCVASKRSAFKTDQISGEYMGIFAISDKWWCENENAGKHCNIKCSDLLDEDISDDVKCALKILHGFELKGWGQSLESCDEDFKNLENDCPLVDETQG